MNRYTIYTISAWLLLSTVAKAQMPNDGFTMDKGIVCTVLSYGQSQWDHYWEGTRYRDNPNIGTFTSKAIMPMLAYGITDNLNIFASLPHINNNSSAGTMTGKKGWQDFSIDAKYKLAHWHKDQIALNIFVGAGVSLPATGYVPDFLPYSIGLGSQNLTGRIIAHATFKKHVFVTGQAGYTAKSNIKVDRATYYANRQINSNEMRVPNVWSGSVAAGYDNSRIRADLYFRFNTSETGSDIRPNDMPMPIHKMKSRSIGFNGLFWVPKLSGLGLLLSVDNTIGGRNIGKSFTWMTGLQYFFTPFKKQQHAVK